MAGWSLATRVGACGATLAEDVYPRDGIAGFGGGLLCGSLSTDTDVRRALSFRTGMAQYSQHHLRRPSGHIHNPTSERKDGLGGIQGQPDIIANVRTAVQHSCCTTGTRQTWQSSICEWAMRFWR